MYRSFYPFFRERVNDYIETIEYLPLDTDVDFLIDEQPKFTVTNNKIVVRTQRIEDGFPYKKLNILNMYKSSDYIFMEYKIDNKSYFGFYNQQNKVYYNTISGLDDDIYKTGKIIPRPLNGPESQMYFIKYAYEVQDIINNVSENDNPVIMLLKLKE